MSAYWPPLENLPTFDVLVFRNAQDVVDFSIATDTASKIALTSDNSSTTSYIPFSKTTSATSNTLYIDDITTLLRYRPDTGEVSASRFTIGGILNPSAGDIASRLFQFTGANPVLEIRNFSTSGRIRLVTADALNASINVVTLSTSDFTTITTNNPTITGFTDPIASDSTSRIATTRWVQTAITAGSSAIASNIAGGVAGDLLYQSAPSTTAKLPIGANTYILTSNGTGPVWTAPGVISTPTLANVLLAGNSAGATDIDMNTQSITNATSMTATTFNGSLNGTASLATNVSLGSAGDLLYQSAANTTSKLGIGANTYILTSNGTGPVWTAPPVIPGTPTLSAVLLAGNSAGATNIDMNTQSITNATSITATTFNGALNGNANTASTSAAINTTTLPGSGTFYLPFLSSATGATTQTLYTGSGLSYNATNGRLTGSYLDLTNLLRFRSAGPANRTIENTFYQFHENDAVAGGTYRGRFYSNSATLFLEFPNLTHTFSINCNTGGGPPTANPLVINPTDFTIATTNCPTFTYTTLPATTDNTYKVATTNWVQTALTSGVATATTINVQDNNTATFFYPVFCSAGVGQKSLLFDTGTNPFYYQPSTSTLTATNFAGSLVGTAQTTDAINITADNTGTTHYLTFALNNGVIQTLKVDNGLTPLSYVPDTSTLTASVFVGSLTGLASQATTVAVADNNTAGPFYPVFCTGTAGQKSLLFDSITAGTLSYVPSTSTLTATNFSGLASQATTVAVADNNTAGPFYPVFCTATAGQKSLLFDSITAGTLSYVPSTSTLTATNFSGLASQSTTVAVADDDSATTMYPVFCTGTAGQKSLLFDSTTTPLRYKPDSGVMSAVQFAVGAFVEPVAGDNAGLISQNTGSSATVVQNQATSGLVQLISRDAANNSRVSLQTSSTDTIIYSRNVKVDNGSGNPIVVGNGASTATSNIIMTSLSLAATRNFTLGGNVIIGSVAGNSLPVAATDNTFVGDSAGASATGSNNICIGYNSQVPTAASSNQIAIGTASETLYVRGGFNWRIGTQITATINLSAVVLAQFYTVAMSAASQTITLPNPTTAAYLGAKIVFKRKTNTTAYNLAAAGTTPFLGLAVVAPVASPITIGATLFQVELVCDGVNWCIISTT